MIMVVGVSGTAWAQQDSGVDDIRMEVVSNPDADEAEFTEEIELPEGASDQAHDKPARGTNQAHEAREDRGRASRSAVSREAREARESGRDAGQARGKSNRPGAGQRGKPKRE